MLREKGSFLSSLSSVFMLPAWKILWGKTFLYQFYLIFHLPNTINLLFA